MKWYGWIFMWLAIGGFFWPASAEVIPEVRFYSCMIIANIWFAVGKE